jgi:hypothetical protein
LPGQCTDASASSVGAPVVTGYAVDEVWRLLGEFSALAPEVVLVGGQVLAFWAR